MLPKEKRKKQEMEADEFVCFLDTFCQLQPDENAILFIKKICLRLWDLLIEYQMKYFFTPGISQSFLWIIEHTKNPLTIYPAFFFFLMGTEEGVRRVIDQQLARENDPRAQYFREVFVPFCISSYECLADQAFLHCNIIYLFEIYVTHLQLAWLSQLSGEYIKQHDRDVKEAAQDKETIETNRLKKLEARKRKKNKEALTAADELEEIIFYDDFDDF